MGYKLIAQLSLIAASLVLLFTFVQPTLGDIKSKQDELFRYNEAIAKASQYNARLRELITIRDSFSTTDLQSLEKFVPTEIDQLKIMSEIAGIFSNRMIVVNSMTAQEIINPTEDIAFESGIVEDTLMYKDVSYQDFEVTFTGTYDQLREILMLTEASDTLLEIVELNFDSSRSAEITEEGDPSRDAPSGQHIYTIIFRAYGLPIDTSV